MSRLIRKNVSLKDYSNYKIGGDAKYFLEFHNLDELKKGLEQWQEIAKEKDIDTSKIFVIGGATNILFSDEGFDGLILKNSIDYIEKIPDPCLPAGRQVRDDGHENIETSPSLSLERRGVLVEVGAGTSIEKLNNYCIEYSLSGTEWSGGLPGTMGGAIFGNAGAFGGETKDSILKVRSIQLSVSSIVERDNKQCRFGYRNSIFKENMGEEIVISAVFELKRGDREKIEQAIQEKIDYRKNRQPLEYPNIGSTFKNIDLKYASPELIEKCKNEIKNDPFPVIPVAYLIHLAGLSGERVGGAMISEKHPNFIINLGDAKAEDVKKLIKKVEDRLDEKFCVKVETEVVEL